MAARKLIAAKHGNDTAAGAWTLQPVPERRANARGELVSLIAGTYREMPGLSLKLPQAARLFGLRELTCKVILEDLVREGRLRVSHNGQFVVP
jgi:hypothetical protein